MWVLLGLPPSLLVLSGLVSMSAARPFVAGLVSSDVTLSASAAGGPVALSTRRAWPLPVSAVMPLSLLRLISVLSAVAFPGLAASDLTTS